jgi:predicted PurR-regulated permease PerM
MGMAFYILDGTIILPFGEGNILVPVIHHRTVSLPPALTITCQVLLGVLVGGLGVVVATPLTAAALVLVKILFVEDALGDSVDVPGEI